MKEITLVRTTKAATHTRGVLIIDDMILPVLERPDLNNAPNISCIPPGEYYCKFLPRSASGRWRNVYHLLDVPGRSGIFIHTGNLVEQTHGCIVPGIVVGKLAGKEAVLSSGSAMLKIRAALGRETSKIRII